MSLDNLVGGTSLGLPGSAPWIPTTVFGATTAVMSLIGPRIGGLVAGLIRIRSDLLSGVALILAAATLPLLSS